MTASILARRSDKKIVRDGRIHRRGGVPFWLPPMLLLAALAVGGCGGSEPEPSAPPETPQTSEEPVAQKPGPSTPEPAQKPAEEPLALLEEPPQEKPPRPESVLDWTAADYISAREDRDPRLVDAVAFLGEQGVGDEQTAQLLSDLLTTVEAPLPDPSPQPKAEPPAPKPKRPSSGDDDDDDSGYEEDDSGDDDDEDYGDDDDDDGGYDGYDDDDDGGAIGRPSVGAGLDVALLKPAYVSLTGAIVQALGANGTELSRQTLQQLLAGMIETGSDRVAASAALKALVDDPCPEKDAILFRALTQSETLRPAGRGEVTAVQLRETAMDLVAKNASPDLRMELAKYLLTGSPGVEIRDRLVSFVMASHPYNLKPQTAIYQRPQTSAQIKQNFEVFFTTYSSSALARLLGIVVPPPQEMVLPGLPVAPGEAPQAAQPWVAFGENVPPPAPAIQAAPARGWAGQEDESADEEENYEEEDMMDSSEERDWSEDEEGGRPAVAGPRDLGQWATGEGRRLDAESAAALKQVAQSDPGVATLIAGELWNSRFSTAVAAGLGAVASLESGSQLLNLASTIPNDAARAALFKALQGHRQEGPHGLFAAAALPEKGAVDPGFLAVLKSLPRQTPDSSRSGQERPEHQWLRSSRTLLRYLCDGFRKAAEAGGESVELTEEDLGFKIHEDANIVAAYKLDWQQDVGPSLSTAAVDPLVIRYVCIQDNTRYSRMLGYYRRAVAGCEVREIGNVAWIDSYRPASAAGRMRSVDVLVTRLPENTDPRATQDEPLDVEILWIEINNPGGEQTASVGQ